MWLFVANFLVQESFVLTARCLLSSGHNVPITSNKTIVIFLFCNFLLLCEWESVVHLKVRALRMGYHVYFRL